LGTAALDGTLLPNTNLSDKHLLTFPPDYNPKGLFCGTGIFPGVQRTSSEIEELGRTLGLID